MEAYLNTAEVDIICPVCQNIGETSGKFKPKKCSYNAAKNIWHCFHCGSKGTGDPTMQNNRVVNFPSTQVEFQFSDELLKAYQEELENNDEAKAYLARRFKDHSTIQFELGFDSGRTAIVIPSRNLDGELISVKYRYLYKSDPKFISEPGSRAGFYFIRGLQEDKLLICEGEFDAMAAKVMGFKGNIIAVQTNKLSQNNREKLAQFSTIANVIYIAADQDDAGKDLLVSLTNAGVDRSKIAELPIYPNNIKDLSELLETGNEEKFPELILLAKTEIEQLSFRPLDRLQETYDFLSNKLNTQGWPTGFRLLDDKLGGGLMPHMLTGISAPGKTGKTTFIIQLIYNLLKQKIKTGFISLEMSPTTHVIPSLFSIIMQRNARRLSPEALANKLEEHASELQVLNDLTFMDRYGCTPSELIESWIRHEYSKGTRIFFLDHVGYSLLDIKDSSEHSRLSKTLRSLTRELPINICAVVQPKNLTTGQKYVTKHDLYGSVTWAQDLNELLTLERGDDQNQLNLRLTDSHNPLAKPSNEAIILFYDYETCSLSE